MAEKTKCADAAAREKLTAPDGYKIETEGTLSKTDLVYDNFLKQFRSQKSLAFDFHTGKYGQDPLPSPHRIYYTAVAVRIDPRARVARKSSMSGSATAPVTQTLHAFKVDGKWRSK